MKAKRLGRNLEHQLAMYALAAAAGGVSAKAEASIVYTPDNRTIVSGASGGGGGCHYGRHRFEKRSCIQYSLAHDKIQDFTLGFWENGGGITVDTYVEMSQGSPKHFIRSNMVEGVHSCWRSQSGGTACGYVAGRLASGATIGPQAKFKKRDGLLWGVFAYPVFSTSPPYFSYEGQWPKPFGPADAFLGVRFKINKQIHYGWVHLVIDSNGIHSVGYAYETIANKPIIAGDEGPSKKGTLGSLAAGANGLSTWRANPQAANGKSR